MNYYNEMKKLHTNLKDIREELGEDSADKAEAILSILAIGKTSIAEARAILAATEMALDKLAKVVI